MLGSHRRTGLIGHLIGSVTVAVVAHSQASVLHLGGVLGDEMPVVDGHESDVCRLPDAEDLRGAAGRELPASLLDRELRELGAVVGEAHGPHAVTAIRKKRDLLGSPAWPILLTHNTEAIGRAAVRRRRQQLEG